MIDVVIISAMEEERKEYLNLIANKETIPHQFYSIYKGSYKDKTVISIVSGIGKTNSAATTSFVIETFKPKLIINVGTCGGFAPCKVADIIVSQCCAYADVDLTVFGYQKGQMANEDATFNSYPNFNKLFENLNLNFVKTGLICTADSFISNQSKIQDIVLQYKNPICVEMEATAIAQVCNHYNQDAIFIKKVSDLADSNASESFAENVNLVNENLLKVLDGVLGSL